MRIGILTYHFSDNFGALLQAYALRRWFIENGHIAEFINYHPDYVEKGGEVKAILDPRNLRSNLKVVYLRISKWLLVSFGNKEKAEKFKLFRETQLGVKGLELLSAPDVATSSVGFDMLVAGSDQIWNPSGHVGLDPVYFLSFDNPSNNRRISYAASFGKSTLDSAYHGVAGEFLRKLDAISVREISGIKIVGDVSSREATVVPDPTFLHDDYSELLRTSNNQKKGHIFCYALRTSIGIRDAALNLASAMGVSVYSPYNPHRRWREIGTTVYPGPEDWLALLSSSSVVLTNSFHATVFSIIFERNFWVIGLPGKKSGLNDRAKNLLAQLGLSSRFVPSEDAKSIVDRGYEDIDWNSVRALRKQMKLSGENFLIQQINELKND